MNSCQNFVGLDYSTDQQFGEFMKICDLKIHTPMYGFFKT